MKFFLILFVIISICFAHKLKSHIGYDAYNPEQYNMKKKFQTGNVNKIEFVDINTLKLNGELANVDRKTRIDFGNVVYTMDDLSFILDTKKQLYAKCGENMELCNIITKDQLQELKTKNLPRFKQINFDRKDLLMDQNSDLDKLEVPKLVFPSNQNIKKDTKKEKSSEKPFNADDFDPNEIQKEIDSLI